MMMRNNPYIFVNSEVLEHHDDDRLSFQPKVVKISNGAPQKLDRSYVPGVWDVICCRGKLALSHPGNKYFRSLVKKYQGEFGRAQTRLERTIVVTNIVDAVRAKGMGFIKRDDKDGHYWQIGDRLSREKVGQMMRDAQGSRYRSSTKAKKIRRQECSAMVSRATQRIVHSNLVVSNTIAHVQETLSTNPCLSDDDVLALLTQANCLMLNVMKQDEALVKQFKEAKASIIDHDSAHDSVMDDESESSSLGDDHGDGSTSTPMME